MQPQQEPVQYLLPHQHKTWAQLHKKLLTISTLTQLEPILKIMNQFDERVMWNCKDMSSYVSDWGWTQQTLVKLIKFVAHLAENVQSLFKHHIFISEVILQKQGLSYISLTKLQALCLVCSMFMCTVKQMPQKNKENLPRYYNFRGLSRQYNEVVKTTLNYFYRSMVQLQKNKERYQKQHIVYIRIAQSSQIFQWMECEKKLCQVSFHPTGKIQDLENSIQIDFANKSIGGFFLTATYTQQDIIFINNPQLMPALLFHRYMEAKECILMVGAERYSLYDGYLETYQFKEDYKDQREVIRLEIEKGKWISVKNTWISAIDAIPYFIKSQFSMQSLQRQLKKAFVGFNIMKLDIPSHQQSKVISTGNWGSGAFMGNLQYKFLIQWLACSKAERKMEYFSFQNSNADLIPKIVEKYGNKTVGQLCKLMLQSQEKFSYRKRIFDVLLKENIQEITEQRAEQKQQINQ